MNINLSPLKISTDFYHYSFGWADFRSYICIESKIESAASFRPNVRLNLVAVSNVAIIAPQVADKNVNEGDEDVIPSVAVITPQVAHTNENENEDAGGPQPSARELHAIRCRNRLQSTQIQNKLILKSTNKFTNLNCIIESNELKIFFSNQIKLIYFSILSFTIIYL